MLRTLGEKGLTKGSCMLLSQNKILRREFKRPITLSSSTETDCYFAEIKINKVSPSLLELVATGQTVTLAYQDPQVNVACSNLMGKGSLECAIYASLNDLNYDEIDWPAATAERVSYVNYPVFFRGLYRSEQDKYIVVFSPKETNSLLCTPHQLVEHGRLRLREYNLSKSEYEKEASLKKKQQELLASNHPGLANAFESADIVFGKDSPDPSFVGINEIPDLHVAGIPPESLFRDDDDFSEAMKHYIARQGFRPPRDGNIHELNCRDPFSKTQGLQKILIWQEYLGAITYADLRWSALNNITEAFRSPLRHDADAPFILDPENDSEPVPSGIAHSNENDFDNCFLDDRDYRNRIDMSRNNRQEHGFEAIGWYQTHHTWDESSWGIYLDAKRLDNFALEIFDDLRSEIDDAMSVACRLAVGLVHSHEFFHARVDAALTWLELLSGSPKHERYKLNCYQVTKMTPDWLEEALANWHAWQWFLSWLLHSTHTNKEKAALTRVIETHLDCSPPGYSNWRVGSDMETINRFAYQLIHSKDPSISYLSDLALDSLLFDELPFVFENEEVPVRWIGSGNIREILDRCPSVLNTITRKEAEEVLRTNDCQMKAGGGKGSHQKWECPDKRTFQIPKGKDLSGKVFKHFLDFLGVDKAAYIEKYR